MNTFACTKTTSIFIYITFFKSFLFFIAPVFLIGQAAPNAQYAIFSGGLAGSGTFNCDQTPDFDYTITGDIDPGDTSVPGPLIPIDNQAGGMETIYGSASSAENIEVEVFPYFGNAGDQITNTVVTTIDFMSPVAAGGLAFLISDVEQDQVMICALDENGISIPPSDIASWFQAAFDADNFDPTTIPPSWDTATGTLVGQEAPGGVKQLFYQPDLPENESGSAWFETDVPITQLQFKSQALGIFPDSPTMHFILASKCADVFVEPEPSDTAIPTMGEWGLMCLALLLLIMFVVAFQQQDSKLALEK